VPNRSLKQAVIDSKVSRDRGGTLIQSTPAFKSLSRVDTPSACDVRPSAWAFTNARSISPIEFCERQCRRAKRSRATMFRAISLKRDRVRRSRREVFVGTLGAITPGIIRGTIQSSAGQTEPIERMSGVWEAVNCHRRPPAPCALCGRTPSTQFKPIRSLERTGKPRLMVRSAQRDTSSFSDHPPTYPPYLASVLRNGLAPLLAPCISTTICRALKSTP